MRGDGVRDLTPEQDELFAELGLDEPPGANEGQTAEQARNFAMESFLYVCELEGLLPLPDKQAIRRRWEDESRPGATARESRRCSRKPVRADDRLRRARHVIGGR
jgi:hypothetical protein